MSIATNLSEVRGRIAAAAERSGRSPSDVTLVAVSKTFGVEKVREAWHAGQREFGENKVQEGLQKIAETTDIPARWHLIGHLQSNKAKKAGAGFSSIHSVVSLDLLQRLVPVLQGHRLLLQRVVPALSRLAFLLQGVAGLIQRRVLTRPHLALVQPGDDPGARARSRPQRRSCGLQLKVDAVL